VSWVLSLTSGNRYHLYTTIGESSVDQSGEETQEATFGSSGDVLFHGTWVLPVAESETVVRGSSTEIDDEREYE